jgi:hypothetical protein
MLSGFFETLGERRLGERRLGERRFGECRVGECRVGERRIKGTTRPTTVRLIAQHKEVE